MNPNTTTKSNVGKLNSIRTKLVAMIIALAAIPLILVITTTYHSSTKKAKTDARENLEWSAWYLQSTISNTMQTNQAALKTFASSASIINYLKSGCTSDTSDLYSQMDTINKMYDDNNVIVISDAKGMMVLRSDKGKCVDISTRDYFKNTIKGKPYVSSVFVSNSTNTRNICIAVPIKDENGTPIGIVHRSFDLNDFHKVLAEDGTESFLVDHTGILAAHSKYEIAADAEPVDFSHSPYMTSNKTSGYYESNATGKKTYVAYVKEPTSNFTVCIATPVSKVVSNARKNALGSAFLGLIALVIATIAAVFIARSFSNPIKDVEKTISALSDGRFVKITKHTNRKDEFGEIVNDTNALIDKLSGIVSHIKESSSTVGESSEELSEMANQIAATTENVAGAVQEIATGAIQQAEEIQNAAASSSKITEAVESVQNSSNDMNDIANRMKDASELSSNSLSILQETNQKMTSIIESISEKISATQDAVANINEHVTGISGIAAQTNLLSLNASIEAARAGEAGRGFAVVATEIQKLANDSEALAQEIRIVMDDLLKQAEEAVSAAEEVRNGNIEQQDALNNTLLSVNGMLTDIEETVSGVHNIKDESMTCVSSNKVVSDAMSSLSAISEENAASSETTGASVEELSATVTSLAESATELSHIADRLNEEMKFFK